MAMMFGRFEIQSELSKSETALIYKAMDTETNQVVALKTQSLEPLGDRADAFVDTLVAEGESTRDLASQNIVLLYGAGEIDGRALQRRPQAAGRLPALAAPFQRQRAVLSRDALCPAAQHLTRADG